MKGTIGVDQAKCACGGPFIKKQFKKRDYWECEACGEEPKLFRVRRYLPGLDGAKMTDIRYDNGGKRIRDLDTARAVLRQIDSELNTGTFDPTKYLLRDSNNLLRFENFVSRKYLPYYHAKLNSGLVKPSSMKAKNQYIKNYLIPYFTGVSIRDIKAGTIREMQVKLTCSPQMKKLVTEELKVILNSARSVFEIPDYVPPVFPKFPKSRLMNPDTFLSQEEQQMVIENISNDQYRVMIEILCHYAIRPSEVRALKWCDLDFKKGLIYIRRHVTMNCIVVDGRKSLAGDEHIIPMSKEFMRIIQPLVRPIIQDTWMFPGTVTEIVPENRLRKAWAAAIKKAGLPHVDLYRGTKSSRLTQMLKSGASKDDIKVLTGHTNVDTVARYAQLTKKDMIDRTLKLLEADGGEI